MATFQQLETSGTDGRPVHLVELSRPNKAWYYASADQDIEFQGRIYTALPMSLTSFIQSGDAKSENLDISLPASATICRYLDLITPTEAIAVKIRKVHVVEGSDGTFTAPLSDDDAPIMWVGEYISISRPTINSRKLTCNTLSLTLNRGGLRLSWSRNCPHVLYGRGCLADKSLFAYPLTNVQVVNGVTISADQFGVEGIGGDTTTATTDNCGDISTGAGWRLGPYQTTARGYYSKVFVEAGVGNPPPSFQILAESNQHSPAYAIKDFGSDGADLVDMSVDVRIGDTGGSSFASSVILFGVDAAGKGPRIMVHGEQGTPAILRIGSANDFDTNPEGTTDIEATCGGTYEGQTWYTLRGQRSGLGDAVTIRVSLYLAGTELGTCVITGTYGTGGFFGPIRAKGDQIERMNIDNFVFSSSTTVATGSMAGGFIEWNSEPGVFERTGIESEGDGVADLLGTTQGMQSGTNFIGYLGCDRTAQMCNDVFHNLDNFGGINHMQGRSPFDGQPVF